MTDNINTSMETIAVNTDVLVIGGGFTGINTASEIADSGYKVVIIEESESIGNQKTPGFLTNFNEKDRNKLQGIVDKVVADDQVRILTQTRLSSAKGVPGNFSISLSRNGDIIEQKFGAVVIATELSARNLNEKYGLSLSKNVLAQSQFEELFNTNKDKFTDKTIAFLVGLCQDGNPLVTERVMRSVFDLNEKENNCSAYIYTGDLKVAADGLERLYKKTRDKGAIYFKLKELPGINSDGTNISFCDPILKCDIRVEPDIIVIEEALCADPLNETLADFLRIDLGPSGFLQKDNVHRFPVCSNREGIFVVGTTRDLNNLPMSCTDTANAVLKVKALLEDGKKIVSKNKAVIDTGKCTFCLTCYRCCPHGAIFWDKDNKPVISPIACQGCGICASECPMDAIQIGEFQDADILKEIKSNITPDNKEPCIIAFCCQNSALEAGLMAYAFNMQLPAGLKIIKVPCAGKIDVDYIMNAFIEGADGVIVMACNTGNCKSETGNIYAGWRVNDVHRILDEVGIEKERLCFAALASNMKNEFFSIAVNMETKIKELGLSPLNK